MAADGREMVEVEGQVLDPLSVRHDKLMGSFSQGVRAMCEALWWIRQERTYTTRGFDSFGSFLRSLHLSAATGRLWANSGPVIEELRRTGDEELIGHPDLVRPIALLLSPQKQTDEVQRRVIKRQAEIVRRAAAVAHRGMEPLTEEVIERVARLNYGILSRDEYRAARRVKQQDQQAQPIDALEQAKRRRQRLELALATILDYEQELRRSGEELAELRNMAGFWTALYLLIDARDA